jgi:hypothetical protein
MIEEFMCLISHDLFAVNYLIGLYFFLTLVTSRSQDLNSRSKLVVTCIRHYQATGARTGCAW